MARQCLEYLPENRPPDVLDILHRLQSIQTDSEGLYEGLNSIEVSAIERQKVIITSECHNNLKL